MLDNSLELEPKTRDFAIMTPEGYLNPAMDASAFDECCAETDPELVSEC